MTIYRGWNGKLIDRKSTNRRVDDTKLKELWDTYLTDKEIAEILGHHRAVFRRRAEQIGLPPRNVARRQNGDSIR